MKTTTYSKVRAVLCAVLLVALAAALILALPQQARRTPARAETVSLSNAEKARLRFAMQLQQQSQYNFTPEFTMSDLPQETVEQVQSNLQNLKTVNTAVTALGLVTKYAAPILGKAAVRGFLSQVPGLSHVVSQYITGVSTYEVGKNVEQVYSKLSVQMDDIYNALSADMQDGFKTLSQTLTDCYNALKDQQDMNTYYDTMREFATEAFYDANSRSCGYYAWVTQLAKDYKNMSDAIGRGASATDMKVFYDALYRTASQVSIIYGNVVPMGEFSGTPLFDAMYNYYLLNSISQQDPNQYLADSVDKCMTFVKDVYSNYQFANTCLALCYRYQVDTISATLQPGENIENKSYTPNGMAPVLYSDISGFSAGYAADISKINAAISRFYCRLLNLDETYYLQTDNYFGRVIYHEMATQAGPGAQQMDGFYLNVNDAVPSGAKLHMPAISELLSYMFDSDYTYRVSDTAVAQADNSGVITVTGSTGEFDVIFDCEGQNVFKMHFSIGSTPFASEGTTTSPYLIDSAADLARLANDPALYGYHYLLTRDLDLSGTAAAEARIGTFTGTFDGGGHTLYHKQKYALFDNNLGTICNLTLSDATITESQYLSNSGEYHIGGIANTSGQDGAIVNCHFVNSVISADVSGVPEETRMITGGIVGHLSHNGQYGNTRIENCSVVNSTINPCLTNGVKNDPDIHQIYSHLGAIAGYSNAVITNCVAVGNKLSAKIQAHSWWTDLTGQLGLWGNKFRVRPVLYLGELVGTASGGRYTDCYYAGNTLTADLTNPTNDDRTNFHEQLKYMDGAFGSKESPTLINISEDPSAEDLEALGWDYFDRNGDISLSRKQASKLTVVALPNKTTYGEGESLNLAGLLLATDDGQLVGGPLTATDISSSPKGAVTVTVTWNGLSTQFTVYVVCLHKNTTTNGNKITCNDCNETLYDCNTDEHIWVGECTEAASCDKAGKMHYHCIAEHECDMPEGYDEEIPMTDHNWQKGTYLEPSCTVDGYQDYTCQTCGTTRREVLPHTGHHYTAQEQSATCEADGKITYTCSNCDNSYEVTIAKLGHNYVVRSDLSRSATCTEDGVEVSECTNCHDRQSKTLSKTGHSLNEMPRKDPTCTEQGYVQLWYCSNCEKVYKDAQGELPYTDTSYVIDALGHLPEEKQQSAATCTEPGYVHCFYCSRCDKYYTDSSCEVEIPASEAMTAPLGHDLTRHEEKDPTFTEDGNYLYFYCERCHKYFKDDQGNTPYDGDSWRIDKLGLATRFSQVVSEVRPDNFDSIVAALQVYDQLSIAERQDAAVKEDYAVLQRAIEQYNASMDTINDSHKSAKRAVSISLGLAATVTALAAAAYVCKFTLGR